MLRLYVALYDIGESGSCHCSLFAVDQHSSILGRVWVFQIVTSWAPDAEDGYVTSHGQFSLMNIGAFICAFRLPSLDMSITTLREYMATQYVGQRGSPLIPTPSNRWDCSQWAMRAIQGLVDRGHMIPESDRCFFTVKTVHRPEWGAMMLACGLKAAHDYRTNPELADRSSGMPIMNMERYGIFL